MLCTSGKQKGTFGSYRTFLSISMLSYCLNRPGPWEEYYIDSQIYSQMSIAFTNNKAFGGSLSQLYLQSTHRLKC